MADGRKERKVEKQVKSAALRANVQRKDLRNKFWIYGTGTFLILVLVVAVTISMVGNQNKKARLTEAANKPIIGVQSFTGLSRNHTSKQVTFPQNPPVGGAHSAQFINCGIYTQPINSSEAVHSLEHGAVWVTYTPDLPQKQIDSLTKEAALHPFELLSPYPGLPSQVVASAWGKQLQLKSADDPRLLIFLRKYLQGPQTPEPGAPCSGGVQG